MNAIATRSEHEVDVLVWNYHDDDVQVPPTSIQLIVNGLPKSRARVEQFRMDSEHSNSYRAWLSMGSPATPTAEQLAGLERAGQLESLGSPQTMKIARGKLPVNFDLPRQGVELVRISWK